MTDQRRVEYQPIGSLTPAERNPKRHQIGGIIRSISRFGFTTPAVLDERTGRLVVGHGRIEALTAMRDSGQDPPAGIVVDVSSGEWMVPVILGWSSRSDIEASAYLVADNRHTELGGWDAGDLEELLAEIRDVDEDLVSAVAGFAEEDLAELLAGGGVEELPDVGSPAVSRAGRAEPFTALGDVWIIGRHKIICGDPRDYDTVEHLGGDKKVDVLFATLPAGIKSVSGKSTDDAIREYSSWFYDVQANARFVLSAKGWLVVVEPSPESAVVLLAAQVEGGIAYGADPDPGRVELMCYRIQRSTGIIPILEATGQEHDFLAT